MVSIFIVILNGVKNLPELADKKSLDDSHLLQTIVAGFQYFGF